MARVPISEFKAKTLLLGKDYEGWAVQLSTVRQVASQLNTKRHYVIKVDQGIKKRGKQGLLAINLTKAQLPAAAAKLAKRGFSNFVIEPFIDHSTATECYLSLERTREGMAILYSTRGGVEIEEVGDSVQKLVYTGKASALQKISKTLSVKSSWLKNILERMDELHLSFIEINPLLVINKQPVLLDCAAMVDSASAFFVGEEWNEDDFVSSESQTVEEQAVKQLAENSASSLTLRVLNPNGGLAMLLSGGGASIALADAVADAGKANQLLDYGEYSGNPTTEETYLYTKNILSLLLKSKAKHKALVIAGGVANFTSIPATFKGVIQALAEQAVALKRQKIKVYVRRGGPGEAAGLNMMEKFLKQHGLFGSVAGSGELLTKPVKNALGYIK